MKRLRYKTKKEPEISLEDIPEGFTQTHSFEYTVKKGKLKPHKKKTNQATNK